MKVKTKSGSTYTFENRDGKIHVKRESKHCILAEDGENYIKGTENTDYVLDSMPYIIVGQRMDFGGISTSPVKKILN